LAFKDRVRRFFGIKTEEELRQKKTTKQKTKEFFESLLFAGIAAAIIITFIIQNTRIPTGSMENTILVGDFVLVNKFIYGSSSPRYIPFTEIALPYFTLPAIREPRPKDIVVFEYPGDRDQLYATPLGVNYVKRLIGMPGDTVHIIDKVVFINHREFWIPSFIKYIKPFTRPKEYAEPRIFPKGMPWNEDNYGPLIVPKKGSVVQLTVNNVEQWRTIIDREHGERVVRTEGNQVFINNVPVNQYTFKKDYYFMIGDNRDDSLDSRFWGFVPRDLVIGQAFITLFSWDREIPFSQIIRLLGSIRPDRILKVLD
jgi:signal peptidase I